MAALTDGTGAVSISVDEDELIAVIHRLRVDTHLAEGDPLSTVEERLIARAVIDNLPLWLVVKRCGSPGQA